MSGEINIMVFSKSSFEYSRVHNELVFAQSVIAVKVNMLWCFRWPASYSGLKKQMKSRMNQRVIEF
jgi:hypothetical protein